MDIQARDSYKKSYFWTLDILRYLSAVSILIWHFQHFYLDETGEYLYGWENKQPFSGLFKLFYSQGFLAVSFFWMISGFVLSVNYLRGEKSIRTFAINRIARLYPLHLLTFILVVVLQILAKSQNDHYEIYKENNLVEFLGNIFFMNNGNSFNGPIWSLSVEIILYLVFAILIIRFQIRSKFSLILTICFFLVLSFVEFPQSSVLATQSIPMCGAYFFSGALIFEFYRSFSRRIFILCGLILVVSGCFLLTFTPLFFFASIIMVLLSIETLSDSRSRIRMVAATLGNLTYASYLIHIPLQILFLSLIRNSLTNQTELVSSRYFFITWFLLIHLISYCSFRGFEAPINRLLRQKLSRDSGTQCRP
jgi:peptidoglycan/LPS O-acetylase OafA/YrhL